MTVPVMDRDWQDERLSVLIREWVGGAEADTPAVTPPPRPRLRSRLRLLWTWRLSVRFRGLRSGGRNAR
ncbi:hypothetical protein [Embleya sp. NPDC005575]|uniref:hypothetical protein n=1 Tax=Embleya sp. NPDC005575 TaxID=3156892 RepID=UPI0033AEB417